MLLPGHWIWWKRRAVEVMESLAALGGIPEG